MTRNAIGVIDHILTRVRIRWNNELDRFGSPNSKLMPVSVTERRWNDDSLRAVWSSVHDLHSIWSVQFQREIRVLLASRTETEHCSLSPVLEHDDPGCENRTYILWDVYIFIDTQELTLLFLCALQTKRMKEEPYNKDYVLARNRIKNYVFFKEITSGSDMQVNTTVNQNVYVILFYSPASTLHALLFSDDID